MYGNLHLTYTETGNNIIQLFCSSILFWNNPAMKSSSEKLKEEDIFGMPFDVPGTSKHLDLCWKPLVKVL